MRINLAGSHRGVERIYYLAVLVLLLAVVILTAGCTTEEKSGGTAQPMPSPPPADDTMGDTPIIISGGSIHLDFRESPKHFRPCTTPSPCPVPSPSTNNVYYWPGEMITAATIYVDDPGPNDDPNPIPLSLTPNADNVIRIEGQGLQSRDITITSRYSGTASNRMVMIHFDESPAGFHKRSPGSKRRTNRKMMIRNVYLNGTRVFGPSGNGKLWIEIK